MGLCKCPKRKVTNQFCFEHRVNVCEHCLVASHPKCIVKSYLHWLQDSDYTPVCLICNEDLSQDACIRLQCYDVFHWNCLSQMASRMAPSTIKTELICPTCKAPVLPPEKLVSPVADAVRQKLSTATWGRKMLGLPLEEKKVEVSAPKQQAEKQQSSSSQRLQQDAVITPSQETSQTTAKNTIKHKPTAVSSSLNVVPQVNTPSSSHGYNYTRDNFYSESQTPRKVYDTRQDERLNIPYDNDENKYKRKGFFVRIGALLSLRKGSSRRGKDEPRLTFRRVFIFLILLLIGFMTVILILSHVGRGFANTDPLLDPKANPNIHVDDSQLVS